MINLNIELVWSIFQFDGFEDFFPLKSINSYFNKGLINYSVQNMVWKKTMASHLK